MQICTVLTLALVVGSRALPRATGSLDSTPEAC